MRKILWALAISALAVLGLGTSAQAAGVVTTGSSCNLSAHWKVSGSVLWNNTNGPAPIIGTVKYVALSSPGQIDDSFGATRAYTYNRDGGGGGNIITFSSTGYSNGAFHYRSDPTTGYLNIFAQSKVVVTVEGGNAACEMTIKPIT